ncbi:MAG: hypothetical protein LAN18_05090 [Acidobacteriia bacterium]|nr:hypothetical protein [Terriglobia bacterium]
MQKLNPSQLTLRNLITILIRKCPKSRAQIAEELTALTGQRVTAQSLYGFTSFANKQTRFPAEFVEPFCQIVGNDELQRHLLSARLVDLLALGEVAHSTLSEATERALRAGKRRRSARIK